MIVVQKRNGKNVLFNKHKIVSAINKAFIEVDGQLYETDTADNIANDIEIKLKQNSRKISTVEEIQDLVEDYLMAAERKDVAKAYIHYRYLHGLARNDYKDLMDIISEKISGSNIQNQNANIDEASFGGRVGEASDQVMKKFALDYCVSPMAKYNHLNNEIYIHDLNSYAVGMSNCLSIPFDDLLAKGFNTRQTSVRPAQSINTAFQLIAVIFQLQSLQQFGGCSATHLDWTMVPYVRKSFAKHYRDGLKYLSNINNIDYEIEFMLNNASNFSIEEDDYKAYNSQVFQYALDMTTKEVEQAVEGLFHNLNTLQSRSGNQLPFTSTNFGTCTSSEGRMISKALLDCCIKGIGKNHRTSIFPCTIFQCAEGINRKPGDPNYDLFLLALKSTSKRLYPNYANVNWSGNEGYDKNDPKTYFSTMGKRKLQPM